MRVAVVGAGGFLGTTIVQLNASRANGLDLVGVVRGPHSLAALLGTGVDVVQTGGTESGLADAIAGSDAVIDVSVGPAPEILPAASSLARACRRAGIPRLVYTSSAAAQPIRRHLVGRRRPGTYYGRQKALAERTLTRELAGHSDLVIVRPGLIWGPRSPWTVRHVGELVLGAALVAPRASSPNLAYSANLADGLLMAAAGHVPPGGTYGYVDAWWTSWEDYLRAIAAGLHLSDAAVRTAAGARPGPIRALAVEQALQHPAVVRLARALVERGPATLTGGLRTLAGGARPPFPADPDSEPQIGRGVLRMRQGDLDVFTRWRPEDADLRDALRRPEPFTRAEAVTATVAWAAACDLVPVRSERQVAA